MKKKIIFADFHFKYLLLLLLFWIVKISVHFFDNQSKNLKGTIDMLLNTFSKYILTKTKRVV